MSVVEDLERLKQLKNNEAIAGLSLSILFLVVIIINSALGVILYSSLYY